MSTPPDGLSGTYSTALVTGASSGIGQAIAQRLLQAGLTVYGTTRNPSQEGLHPDIRWLAFDGSGEPALEAFIEENGKLLAVLDILVNNAGSCCFGSIEAMPPEAISAQHNLLLEAPVRLSRAVLPGMRRRGRGAIVNVSSLASVFPLPYMSSYSAGKAALSAFTQSLILTENGSGLVLIDFQPGDYRTAFNDHMECHGELTGPMKRAWQRMEDNLKAAPPPEKAAADVVGLLHRGRSGTFRSGGFFQAVVAPLGIRLLPRRVLMWAIGRYFQLK